MNSRIALAVAILLGACTPQPRPPEPTCMKPGETGTVVKIVEHSHRYRNASRGSDGNYHVSKSYYVKFRMDDGSLRVCQSSVAATAFDVGDKLSATTMKPTSLSAATTDDNVDQ